MITVSWCLTKFMIWKKSGISQKLCSYVFARWCNYIQNELSWKHLLVTSPRLTYFVLGATFDTLPSPTNLKRWHITTEEDCSLCSVKVCTTAHVLSGCKVALSQGRYTFRHYSILRVLHNSLSKFLSLISPVKACPSLSSCFVKQGLTKIGFLFESEHKVISNSHKL